MQTTTIRIEDELHEELSDVTHKKRKTDKLWSMNKEIILRLESYAKLINEINGLVEELKR